MVQGEGYLRARLRHYPKSIALLSPESLAEVVAELDRLRAATTWQPIETVPKEGTYLVWIKDALEPYICICFGNLLGDETHWMPLAAPPVTP